ncbi:MAG: amino acid permease, partial [Flavobacterium sp.]
MAFSSLFRKKTVQDILKQIEKNEADGHASLGRHLTARDLTAFGIAAIVGAGIFSTIGKASSDGGPAVIFLFLFTALACSFAAFAYAEFASMVPVSGSAYTYSYVAFGELMAWIIGWALIMEYAIGNITVAISWSDYFTGLLESGGIHLPQWVQMDYLTASTGYRDATALMQGGKQYENLGEGL